jgi:DNA-binding NarL/FixJ family response regulator
MLASKQKESLGPNAVRKIRVLLADDHKLLRGCLAHLLGEEPDIEVVEQAGDGREAVEMALATHPDVVLMDVSMPQMSGIEATQRIKRQLPGVRVIGLSMHEEDDMADAMLRAGAVAYFTKSGPSELLLEAIRNGSALVDAVS